LLTVVFQYVAHLKSVGAAPYPIMVFAAAMPWNFFTTSLTGASQSVIGNAGLISKIYFPRLIVPAGAVVTALADLFCSFILLVLIMAWYRYLPTWHLLVLPLLVVLVFAAALGPGLLLTALTVKYRDFRIVTPFIIQLGALATPIGYAASNVPARWQVLYSLNPMVAVVEDFRWAILGGKMELSPVCQATSLFMILFFLVFGIQFFRRTERSFADLV
jgi:lipopolysaccharide transport system permease protein